MKSKTRISSMVFTSKVSNRTCLRSVFLGVCLIVALDYGSHHSSVRAEQLALSSILPKLEAIHEDASALLIKNGELKTKILIGLQAQNDAKLKLVRDMKSQTKPLVAGINDNPSVSATNQPTQPLAVDTIDFGELDDFNKWVDANLEYAVKNTQASIEGLKEEASTNNGQVDYSEQAIKDGIEGVKYWQSAVIFQDKTLKNEKFEPFEP